MTRINGLAETVRCTQYNDSRHTVTNTRSSVLFTDLQEFSNYTVTVTAMFSMLIPASSNLELTTLSAGMGYINACTYVHNGGGGGEEATAGAKIESMLPYYVVLPVVD